MRTEAPHQAGRIHSLSRVLTISVHSSRKGCRLAGAPIPVPGVRKIALDPVQIGMHPGAIGIVLVLREAMRRIPIAFGLMPHRGQRRAHARWRPRILERRPKGFEADR
jgi:hypothetical protein